MASNEKAVVRSHEGRVGVWSTELETMSGLRRTRRLEMIEIRAKFQLRADPGLMSSAKLSAACVLGRGVRATSNKWASMRSRERNIGVQSSCVRLPAGIRTTGRSILCGIAEDFEMTEIWSKFRSNPNIRSGMGAGNLQQV